MMSKSQGHQTLHRLIISFKGKLNKTKELDYQSFRYQCPDTNVQHLWTLVLLGLVKTSVGLWSLRLDFFHSETELSHLVMDMTPGIWRQSFVFASINFATNSQILLCIGPQNAFPMTSLKNPISNSNRWMDE